MNRLKYFFAIMCVMCALCVFLFLASARVDQPVAAAAGAALPLQELLNPDGTLNLPKGQSGAIDPSGWQMVSGPNEAPRFAPLAPVPPANTPGDENWAGGFHVTDFDSPVHNFAVDGSGNVYAMGGFYYAGGTRVNGVARWNGTNWSAMGYGFDDTVWAMVVYSSTKAYAVGEFENICNDAACSATTPTPHYLARWDGTSWSAEGGLGPGPGLDYYGCYDIAKDSSDRLYLACNSEYPTMYLRRWNGSAWEDLGSPNGDVRAVLVSGNILYAGGSFTSIGGGTQRHVAQMDISTKGWSSLGYGFRVSAGSYVNALALDGNGNLYAGGTFLNRCTSSTCLSGDYATARYIAVFSAGSWATMGGPSTYGLSSSPGENGLAGASGTGVYVGGGFISAGGSPVTVNRLAYWNGSAWSAVGSGVNGDVNAVYRSGTTVYVGGDFNGICDADACTTPTFAGYSATWDGSNWSTFDGGSVGPGLNGNVNALAFDSSGNVYAGGTFVTAGETFVNRVAVWNGTIWSALGNGFNDSVYALAIGNNNDLYAGGAFTGICDNPACTTALNLAARVARWDGSSWSGLGSGFDDAVYALAFRGSTLYAGGAFTQRCADIGCMTYLPTNYIATYNGSTWGTLGYGFTSYVRTLAFDSIGNLYAGGLFFEMCDSDDCNYPSPANYIARWNSPSWSMVGNGLNDSVMALAVDSSDNVYAGGSFTAICDDNTCYYAPTATNRIALWNGANWSAVGNGVNSTVQSLALDSSDALYAGGLFSGICDDFDCYNPTPASYIARWNGVGWSAMGAGIDATVYGMAFQSNGRLYVGHAGWSSGGKVAERLAQWTAATAVCGVTAGNDYTLYSGNMPVQVHVTTEDDLDCISAQRFNRNHPNATGNLQTGYYWAITGTTTSGGAASGFSVNLTLPFTGADNGDEVCRYTGIAWDCARTGNTTSSVTRNGVTSFSDWVVENNAPTAVTLVSFTAAPQAGGIGLEWETASELELVGFNLYRSDAPEGVYARLNGAPIAAKNPGGVEGAAYAWHDAGVQPGVAYYYKLEAIDLHGANMLGSAWATAPYGVWLPLVCR